MTQRLALTLVLLLAAGSATAQPTPPSPPAPPPPAYGMPIDLAGAKKVAAAAIAEAQRHGLFMAVAVTDPSGELVYLEKMDNTQIASVKVAEDKARSATIYRRPTKVFEDIVAGGGAGLRILGLRGAVPVEGGVPIMAGGRIVGAIGVSGGSSAQDGMVAKAGAAVSN